MAANLSRREFTELLGAAALAGLPLGARADSDPLHLGATGYVPPPFGNVSLLHLTDCHAQLVPLYFREPDTNLGVGARRGQPPHQVGSALLQGLGLNAGSREAYAMSCLGFERAARRYGKVGGFAHLATLVRRLRDSRPGALLLDGGDSWQGSATALWTEAEDMVQACQLLGVDIMTGHWEFTLGSERLLKLIEQMQGRIEFLAHNVSTLDFDDPVFKAYSLREINGVPCAIIGQAYPYTPIAHPRRFVPDWRFGIQEQGLQTTVDAARAAGAQAVVLLSHNGMDIDLKLASRVSGIDAILGGHTHDALLQPIRVANRGGSTLVTNAGCHGKFLGLLDLDVRKGRVVDMRYRLLPVFADLLPPDPAMAALINQLRAPFEAKLREPLGVTEGLLYRRGNFNGTADQLLLDALREVQGTPIALSPGFRWGGTLLPGQTLDREWLMGMTATTYSHCTRTLMRGDAIKAMLEDVADNLFNPDPYYQQGGDMVRVAGLHYRCTPGAAIGQRIDDLRLANGQPLQADRSYPVAGWAPMAAPAEGVAPMPVWDPVETWLKAQGPRIAPRLPERPKLRGVDGDPGLLR